MLVCVIFKPFTRFSGVSACILLLFILGIIAGTGCTIAEKNPVTLSIGTVPEVPAIDQGFRITGKLSSESGEALGNKRVTLETSRTGSDSDSFSFLAIGETTKAGIYEFYRPVNTSPEFLRVRFAGNSQYDPAKSQVIPVRGAGTDSPQIRHGETGRITVSTDPAGADIYIDSVYRGITPGMIGGLAEGPHILEIAKAGYQNETMEAYVTSSRGSSFSITLNHGGPGITTGGSSSLSFSKIMSEPKGEPDFAVDIDGMSMRVYGNSTNSTDSHHPQITTIVSDNLVDGGHNYMIIMKDH